jgi:hypothetical protein
MIVPAPRERTSVSGESATILKKLRVRGTAGETARVFIGLIAHVFPSGSGEFRDGADRAPLGTPSFGAEL